MAQEKNKDLIWWVGGVIILGVFLGLFYSIVAYQQPQKQSTNDSSSSVESLDTVTTVGSPAPATVNSTEDLDASLKALDDTPVGDESELEDFDSELEAL